MKRINTTKLMALLASLCLITSSFVGSTLAKYTTEVSGSDTARVAKFGVELTADTEVFAKQYTGTNAIAVKSANDTDVIAPGTTDTAVAFTIKGAPEVDVEVYISLSGDAATATDDLTIATLPAGDYNDYTAIADTNADGMINDSDIVKFNLAADYNPVKWTLKKDGVVVTGYDGVTLKTINTYLETFNKVYNVESNEFAAIVGDYELTWVWDFDASGAGTNDQADTFMGQVAAGVETAPTGYVANESFNFVLNVTQVD